MIMTKVVGLSQRGNAYLAIRPWVLKLDGIERGDAVDVTIQGARKLAGLPFFSGYYCRRGERLLVETAAGLELAIRQGNMAEQFGLRPGDAVTIVRKAPRRFFEQENAYSFEEITDVKRYKDVESFANFRQVVGCGMGFYRSASPLDNTYGRAVAVRNCVEKYEIRTIIDMADTADELEQLAADGCQMVRHGTKFVYRDKTVFACGNDAGIYSAEFASAIREACLIIAGTTGPFLIHCRAGKRRSGFLCAILQELNGLSEEKIVRDYMVSYENNNGISREANPMQYDFLANDTIIQILNHIRNGDACGATAARRYLIRIGVDKNVIDRIVTMLQPGKSPR